jgi:hypothetical protein
MILASIATIAAQLVYDLMAKNLGSARATRAPRPLTACP